MPTHPKIALGTMRLPPVRRGGRVYLVSDMHLGDGSHADPFQGKDEHFLAFLEEVEREAQSLVIVGDALDFDQAWYFERILAAHGDVVRRLTELGRRRKVVYIYGNHDPDIVLLRDFLAWDLCDKVVMDGRTLVVHGYEFDSYVSEHMGHSSFYARLLMGYERLFKTWVRVPLRDYYTLSNRVAHWLFLQIARVAHWLGVLGARRNRPELGGSLREQVRFWTRAVLGDPMGLTRPVLAMLEQDERYDTIVCGHSHIPGVVTTRTRRGERRYVNLGSWSFGNSQYGVWDGDRIQVHDWITRRTFGDENYRHILDGRADWTYEKWFADQYLGWLRFRCGEEALRQGVRPRPWALSQRPADLPVAEIDTVADERAPVSVE